LSLSSGDAAGFWAAECAGVSPGFAGIGPLCTTINGGAVGGIVEAALANGASASTGRVKTITTTTVSAREETPASK
jgi:hypothetical protein